MKDTEIGTLSSRLEVNIANLYQLMGESSDVVIKELQIEENTHISLIYIDGLVDTQVLHNSILYSLQEHIPYEQLRGLSPERKFEMIKKQILIAGDIAVIDDYSQFIHHLLSGNIMLLLDGLSSALRIGLPGWEDRNVGSLAHSRLFGVQWKDSLRIYGRIRHWFGEKSKIAIYGWKPFRSEG